MDVKEFGLKLKRIRQDNQITQEQLAGEAEIAISQLGRIERGEINTGLSTIFSIAKALKIQPHQLFYDIDNEEEDCADIKLLMDAVTKMAASEFQFISPLINNGSPVKALSEVIKKLSEEVKDNMVSKIILERVLKISNMGYWEHEEESKTAFWCNNMFTLFGLENKNNHITHEMAIQTVKECDRKRIVDSIKGLFISGEPIQFDYTAIHSSGREFIVLVEAHLLEVKATNTKKIIGTSKVLNKNNHIDKGLIENLSLAKKQKEELLRVSSGIQQEIQIPLKSIYEVIHLMLSESASKYDDSFTRKLNYIKDSCDNISSFLTELDKFVERD